MCKTIQKLGIVSRITMPKSNQLKWEMQGRNIRAVQSHLGYDNTSQFAKYIGVPYSTFQYARKGDRIGPDLLYQLNKKLNVSANYILLSKGNMFIPPTPLPTIDFLIKNAIVLPIEERKQIAVALLLGNQYYESYGIQETIDFDNVQWPIFARKLGVLQGRLGLLKKNEMVTMLDCTSSTFFYARTGVSFGIDLLIKLHEVFNVSLDFMLFDFGSMLLEDKPKLNKDYFIDYGLRLPEKDRVYLASQLIQQ